MNEEIIRERYKNALTKVYEIQSEVNKLSEKDITKELKNLISIDENTLDEQNLIAIKNNIKKITYEIDNIIIPQIKKKI